MQASHQLLNAQEKRLKTTPDSGAFDATAHFLVCHARDLMHQAPPPPHFSAVNVE